MTNVLKVAEGLELPPELQTRATVIYGMRGSGKTSCGVVIAEELWAAALQYVVIDPNGAWWGLRSSLDGEAAGIPILVMGGQHGNVPLEPEAGAFVADLVVDERVSAVLDLSDFDSNEDQVRFVTAFLKQLHQRKKRELERTGLLVIIDEADEFAPQPGGGTPLGGNYALCVGAMKRIVLRDRRLGIGVVLIAQRSAHLNKSVSDGTDLVIAFRTTGARSIKAVRERLEADHGEPELTEAVSQLGKLEDGEALVSSPSWLKAFGRFRWRMRRTFDAGATPEVGVVTREPRVLAEADVARIRERMAATIEKVKAEDPALLRAQLADLRRQLAERPAAAALEPTVILANGALDSLSTIARDLLAASIKLHDSAQLVGEGVQPVLNELQRIQSVPSALPSSQASARSQGGAEAKIASTTPLGHDGSAVRAGMAIEHERRAAPSPASSSVPPTGGLARTARGGSTGDSAPASPAGDAGSTPAPRSDSELSASQQRIVEAVALLEYRGAEISPASIAAIAGVHPNGGRYRGDLKALQLDGLLNARYGLTVGGRRNVARVADDLTAGQQKIVDVIAELERTGIEATPKSIAAWIDLSPNGGRFRADLKHMTTTGILREYRLTEAGRRHIGDSVLDGLAAAYARLDPSTSRLLHLAATSRELTVSAAAAKLNLHPNGGRFRSSIARLAEMGLIRSRADLTLSEVLRR